MDLTQKNACRTACVICFVWMKHSQSCVVPSPMIVIHIPPNKSLKRFFFFFKSRNPFPGPTQVWMVRRTLQHISLLYLICLLIRIRSNGSRVTETQTDRHTNKQAICKIVELRLRPYFVGSTRNSDRQRTDSNWEMTLWRYTFDWYLLSVRLRTLMSNLLSILSIEF